MYLIPRGTNSHFDRKLTSRKGVGAKNGYQSDKEGSVLHDANILEPRKCFSVSLSTASSSCSVSSSFERSSSKIAQRHATSLTQVSLSICLSICLSYKHSCEKKSVFSGSFVEVRRYVQISMRNQNFD